MAQRKEIARMQADLDRRRRDEDEEYARTEEAARERSVRDFELLQMGLEIRNRTAARGGRGVQQQRVVGREGGKILLEEVVAEGEEAGAGAENGDADAEKARGTKRKFELDEDELLRLALEERRRAKIEISAEEAAKKAVKLPSFWVPSLTPSVAAEDMPAPLPKLMPVCPASDKNHIHHYSLKGLVAIKFTEDEDEREKHGDKQRVCPACKKGLNNAAKAMCRCSSLTTESSPANACAFSGGALRPCTLQAVCRQVHEPCRWRRPARHHRHQAGRLALLRLRRRPSWQK